MLPSARGVEMSLQPDRAIVEKVFQWLVDGAPGAPTPMATIARMCTELVTAGVPVARCEAFVRTLHPHIAGRSFVWTPERPDVEVREQTYAFLTSTEFLQNPVSEVFKSGAAVRHRISEETNSLALISALRAEGYTDFYAGPLKFMSGQVHAITFATRAPGGFSPEHLDALAHVLRPLSRVGETFALMRTATNLLATYVGKNTGERVLSGKILRGDVDAIRSVLWFSDLRNFTALSAEIGPGKIIGVLNELFDCQVPAIEAHRGEVLKFIGDGMFAVFPLDMGRSEQETCDAALAAAEQAFAALDRRNANKSADAPAIDFGLALHVGEVAYGNVGGAGRLDFTCIGPAVNLAARLEGLSSKMKRRIVVSQEFAALTTKKLETLGTFELKGVPGAVEAFSPV
jgi:adenylate cyclase